MGIALLNHFQNVELTESKYGNELLIDRAVTKTNMNLHTHSSASEKYGSFYYPFNDDEIHNVYTKYGHTYTKITLSVSASGYIYYTGSKYPGATIRIRMINTSTGSYTAILDRYLCSVDGSHTSASGSMELTSYGPYYYYTQGDGSDNIKYPTIGSGSSSSILPSDVEFYGSVGSSSHIPKSGYVTIDNLTISIQIYGRDPIITDPTIFFE